TPARTPIPRPPAGSATPADVATGTSGPATQDETPTLSPIIVGHEVIIVGTGGLGVSVRADPGKGSDRLFIVLDGERLQVIGGPEEADGLQWWHLRAPSGEEGWGVEHYLQGVAVP
ncbi:MAG: SH3 domain-containing protein, partial [Ardenticatenales bacterium]|nr:SH3 domain-containing protein [Ardenticatenales bacterium]